MVRPSFRVLAHLVRPSTVGALYTTALTSLTLWSTVTDDRFQGVHAHDVQELIAAHFRGEVAHVVALTLALGVLAGLALGALAGLVLQLRDRLARRAPATPPALALRSAGLIVATHAVLLGADMAARPQLYEQTFYDRGGVRAALQLACTGVGRAGVLAIGALALAAWFGASLGPFASVAARARSAFAHVGAPRAVAVAAVGALALVVGLAATRAPEPANHAKKNVLIVAVDSLRFDRVDPRVAPHLAALAARGTRFDRATVPLPRTFPSWVSIATGRYPHHHGIRSMFPRYAESSADLDPAPRRFAHAGYATSVVSDFAGDIFRRVDLGFSRAVTPTFNLKEVIRERTVGGQIALLPFFNGRLARRLVPSLRELHNGADAQLLTSDALGEIDRAGSRPFLVTVFYSTVHFPYAAPAPYYSRFTDASYRGRFRYSKAELLGHEAPPDAADIRQVRGLYDGAVAATDAAIGELLDGLAARGLDKDTIVVLTADHGESLYEPGRGQGHGDHLFGDEALHVPLVIADPGRAPRRVPDQVQSIDIAPTLCALAGVQCAGGLDGRSLVPLMDGKSLPALPAFAETGLWFDTSLPEVPRDLRMPYPDLPHLTEVVPAHDDAIEMRARYEPITIAAKHRMIRDGHYKLIYVPTRAGVRWMLYDTAADPGETHDIAGDHPDVLRRLQAKLWSWMLADPRMERQNGYLVPRHGAWPDEDDANAVRLGDKGKP